jgi:hypothetical protein
MIRYIRYNTMPIQYGWNAIQYHTDTIEYDTVRYDTIQ